MKGINKQSLTEKLPENLQGFIETQERLDVTDNVWSFYRLEISIIIFNLQVSHNTVVLKVNKGREHHENKVQQIKKLSLLGTASILSFGDSCSR